MKSQLSRFTFFLLICLTLSTLNQTVVANLNVGEPRTVRLIYFLPNDRPFRADVVESMKTEIREVQSFYAEQMQAHGYGNKTFQFETDDQGEPIVHRVDGQHPDSHYLDNPAGTVQGEIQQAFDLYANIYFIVLDYSKQLERANGIQLRKNGGFALVFNEFIWFTATHELGHAFGLHHNFRDNAYIMSYGRANRSSAQLSACAAEYLAVHPYFNPDIPIEEGQPPTIELISSPEYPSGSESVPVRLRVRDAEGLHQVLLFVFDKDILSPDKGNAQVKACRGLAGENDAVVEFNYDGEIPSVDVTSLSNPPLHEIRVVAVDTAGNQSSASFTLREVSLYEIATLSGHTDPVISVAFSPDGTTLASGAADAKVRPGDEKIRLWNVATRENIATLSRTTYPHATMNVNSVAFSPDGTTLASGASDNKAKLWDVATRELIGVFYGHSIGLYQKAVNSVAFSPDRTMLAAGDGGTSGWNFGTVKLWDVVTKENIATLEGHPGPVTSVAFSPDGTILASGGAYPDNTVLLWDVAAGESIALLFGHTSGVSSVAFSPDGTTLASGSYDSTIKLWDAGADNAIASFATLTGHTASVWSVAFSPDGTMLASGSLDNKIKLWDTSEWAGTPVVNHAPTGAVTISGTAAVGETLTADASAVMDPDGPETLQFSYQWLASDVLIAGATSRTYTLTENETGETIRVRASYIDGFGAPVNVTSEATESAAPTTTNTAPVFTDGTSTTRTVAENTAANVNIGTAIAAIDADNDTLTYTLGGTNAASFSIDSTSGQLKTRSALDYETKRTYTVTVIVSDGSLTDTITVTINVTDVEDTPVSTLTLLNGRTPQVRDAIVAAVPGINSANDVTAAHLAAITSLSIRGSDITRLRSGDFDGLTTLTTLSVGGTKLSSLPSGIFDNLTPLTELYLGGNNDLNTLPSGIFDNLTALKKLYLSENGMPSLRSGVFDNLTVLEELGLGGNDLRSLPSGIFDNLTALKKLNMSYNELVSLRSGVFDNNTALTELHLYYNDLNSLPSGIFDNNTALTTLTIWRNNLSSLSAGVFDNNTALTNFSIGFNNLSSLPSGIFDKLTNLIGLGLLGNQFRSLPNGIFKGLPTLTSLNVSQNPVDPLPLTVSLEKVSDGQFKAVAPTGAPFDIVLPLSVTDGSISGGATSITIPTGSVESETLTITRIPGATYATTVNIGTLPGLPTGHQGYEFTKSADLPLAFPELGGRVFIPVSERTPQVRDAIVAAVPGVNSAADVTEAHLTAITQLFLSNKGITSLKSGDFDGLTALTELYLNNNALSSLPVGVFDGLTALTSINLPGNGLISLPAGVFDGLTALTTLSLGHNTVGPLPLTVSLQKVADGQFKAVAPTGAPFEIVLPLIVTNGSINSGATTLTIPAGNVESEPLTVTRTAGTTANVTVDIGTLPRPAFGHTGYALVKSPDLPLEVISPSVTDVARQETGVNIPDANLRAKIETALGKTPGDPITAAEMAKLTSLNVQDARITNLTGLETATNLTTLLLGDNSVSDISALTGLTSLTELQLWDNQITNLSALSGLTNLTTLYLWGNSISDISHLAGLTSLTRLRLGENSISNISVVSSLTNLTYLSVKENAISDISAVSGLTNLTQLQIGNNTISDITLVQNLTNLEWLDIPNNSISDISAVQNLTQLVELYFQNNAVSDLSPLVANTGIGTDDELDVRGNPLSCPSIYTHIPALQARDVYIDFDNRVATVPVKILGDTQSGNTGTTLAQPFIVEVRDDSSVAFAGVPVTFAVTAGGGTLSVTSTTTGANGRAQSTLTLGSSAGTNTVRASVQGISASVTFTAEATTTNSAPVFTDGTNTTRTVVENTAAAQNIGSAIAAVDADNDTLTYTLSGTDAAAFNIEPTTGQLRTRAALDYETKRSYTVTVIVSDGSLTDTITVTINVSDIAETSIATTAVDIPDPNLRAKIETALGKASGDPISAAEMATLTSLSAQDAGISNLTGLETATNLTTLLLGNNSISNISAIAGLTKLTELQLWDNTISNISAVAGLTQVTCLYLWGNAITDISAVARLTNLTHLYLGENSLSNISAVAGLTKLIYLNVKENSITNISVVAGLTNLTELLIGNNTISDIAPVGNLTKLVWLDMPNNTISDVAP